ncbi:MAG: hypothetical protein M1827_000683 [Pycnora praestabilis]|nr:MAG: hypothetical protein M1827_000683 [Pycnora praestabilis]
MPKQDYGAKNIRVESDSSDKGDASPIHAERGASKDGKSERADGKREIEESECSDKLGFSYPTWKKWMILTVIFIVQVSMNFNTSVYANAIMPLSKHFSISEQAARVGQMIFLVAYAFGSELWAPWSEDLGRWPILQLSLFLVNIWQLPCALAPNFGSLVVGRFLGGISSAGGSVTLGMVADMWQADDQQYAVAYIVLSSVGGSVVGPIVGAFVQRYLSWRWNFWVQLIFGGFVQVVHFILVPETRATIIMDKEAKRRRKTGEDPNVYGPNELKEHRFSTKEILETWARPFKMFFFEPIVLCLSLLSGFSDALIFTFLESFQTVYEQWNFGIIAIGLAFIPIVIGYLIAWFSFFPFIHRHRNIRRKDPDALQPEARLYWLLYGGYPEAGSGNVYLALIYNFLPVAPLETIGLFGFAWTSLGPPRVAHWIAPMIFSTLIAMANYAIYMATIDYMIASYGPYSASATGGNALARDFLAGIAAMYATPMYSNIGRMPLEYATTILACLAFVVTVPIYIFYWKGPAIRERSRFAQTLASDKKKSGGQPVVTEGEKADAD